MSGRLFLSTGFTVRVIISILNVLIRKFVGLRNFSVCLGVSWGVVNGIRVLNGPVLAGKALLALKEIIMSCRW